MTAASQYLFALSKQIVEPYTQLPNIRSAMVTGSVAKGLSDNYSDIDMTIYYEDVLPAEETLHAIRQGHGGSERKWTIGNHAENSFAEAYDLNGIEVQIGHTTIASWKETMAQVLEKHEVDTPIQKALEGTLACKALYGAEYIDKWKAQIANYPPALAQAMVEQHLKFFPVWGLEPHFRTRDATIWLYQILVEATQNMMGVLAGLNRLYFTTFQFKRMHHFIAQMEIAPVDLAPRIERVFHSDMPQALQEIEALVTDIAALVEEHMPEIDTAGVTRRLGWTHRPWAIDKG